MENMKEYEEISRKYKIISNLWRHCQGAILVLEVDSASFDFNGESYRKVMRCEDV